jgi:Glycosyl hydrolase family 12
VESCSQWLAMPICKFYLKYSRISSLLLTTTRKVSEDFRRFNATWNWPNGGKSVHSYPHVSFRSPLLPTTIVNITNLTIATSWTMSSSPDLMANVALDMFADKNVTAAQSAQKASYEIMVWLATFGESTPLGYSAGSLCCATTLNNVTLFVQSET